MENVTLCVLESYPSYLEAVVSLTGLSQTQVKKQILNKKLAKKKVYAKDELLIDINIINTKKINPVYIGPKIEVLHEDDTFIALDKPSGIHNHPLLYSDQNTALNFLGEHNRKILSVNESEYDRGLLNRLDFETSGVLVFFKDEKLHLKVRQNFSQFVKRKEYLAVVKGRFQFEGQKESYLSSYGPKGALIRAVDKSDPKAQKVSAHFSLVDYHPEKDLSLVKVLLETGHRHQIRVQLQEFGHSIVGDNKYGGDEFSRLMLHAFRYELNFNGRKYLFTAKSFLDLLNFFNLNGFL